MTTPPDSSPSDARLPGWLAEALDVLAARRRVVVAAAVGLLLLGAIVALLLPGVLPPRPIVGAAVGIAAALLATALALAMDASDLVVRGTRHVRAAGGTVDVRVSRQADDVGPLLAAVARHASDGQVRVALSAASRKAGVPGVRAAALAEALARTGRKVLLTDLTRGGSPAAGLSDVIAGTRTLPDVVRFEQELYLARLAVGSDPDVALEGFAGWVDGLPEDLEVLVVALPPLAERGVVKAATSLDCTLVLVEVDRTERVDLIASLDAVDAAGLTSELVLVDPQRTDPVAAAAAPAEEKPAEEGLAGDAPGEDAAGSEETVTSGLDDERPDAEHEPTTVWDPEPEPTGVAPPEPAAVEPQTVADEPTAAGPETQTHEPSPSDDEDLLAAIGLTDDAFDTGEVPVDPSPSEDADASAARGRGGNESGRRDAGEVAAMLGGAGAAAAGAAAFGAPASDHEPESRWGASGEDDRPGDATAEIAMPRPDDGDDLGAAAPAELDGGDADEGDDEVAEADRLSTIWGERSPADEPSSPAGPSSEPVAPAASTSPPAPAPEPVAAPPAAAAAPSPPAPAEPQPEPAPAGLDPASLEVARTSAALHQLAQQIWERDQV